MLLALFVGALLGLALGTVGGGGAVLAVPLLVYVFGEPVHAATTGSLVIVLAAALAGALGHGRRGAIDPGLAARFALLAVPGTIAGAAANRHIGGSALLAGFALVLLAAAWVMWTRAGGSGLEDPPRRRRVGAPAVAAAGLATGALAGLFGVGGGFVVVPVLVLALQIPLQRAIATSLVVITSVSAVGLATHLLAADRPDWRVVLPFAGAAAVAALGGSIISSRLPRVVLGRSFACLLAGVAAYLLASVTLLGGPPHG